MTVFSSVTATLSPELASCMKANGKTWKDAFFDSLKTLVGVEYTVYRKENQWQIKGEWDDIKRAYNILSKVALIEKDAIAAYQAEASQTARACKLASPTGRLDPSRRRGRPPPKKRPYIEPSMEIKKEEVILPPKRKRGRPRKVEAEEVREDSEVEFDEDIDHTSGFEEVVTNTHVVEVETSQPDSVGETIPITCPAVAAVEETVVTFSTDPLEQPTAEERQIVTGTDNLVTVSSMPDEQPLEQRSVSIPPTQSTVGNLSKTHENVNVRTQPQEHSQDHVARLPVDLVEDQRDDDPHVHQGQAESNMSDQISDIVMAVAKEAIACSSVSETRPMTEGSGATLPTLPEAHTDVQTASIFDYLGIKQKTTIDEFNEDNEKYNSEQSKKLEELIEKMIEKMDKTLKEPKPQATGLKYICTECPFTSQKKVLLRNHMKKVHTKEEGMDQDGDGAEHSSGSVVQKKFLGPRKLYRCFDCSYSSNSRKHLKEHKMRKHGEKILECNSCPRKFAVERDLRRHLKDHRAGDVRHACKVCGKKYKQPYVLKRHMETHREGYVKPVYPCPTCPKSFSAKQVLQIHINSVHLGKRLAIPCPVCGKTFTSKHSLAEHQLIHSNAKPYECSICKKAFRHESTLKTHERLHTDNTQQFTCEYCGKAFRLRSSLRIHRNIHTGDKRFDCPICKKTFTQKQSLLRHARIHTGEKPFQCEICGSAFYDYSILRRHVTGVHKMTWKSPTQHYILPSDNYQDGKVIDPPPQDTLPSVRPPQVTASHMGVSSGDSIPVAALTAAHGQYEHQHQQGPVYQPPPMPHTPNTLPEPTHVTQQLSTVQPNNLSTRHIQVQEEKAVLAERGQQQHHQQHEPASYHNSLIYQAPHILLPNALPSNLSLAPPQPPQSPTPLQSPPPPSQHAPLSLAQYQQAHGAPPHTTMSIPSAYALNQQIFYQSHQ